MPDECRLTQNLNKEPWSDRDQVLSGDELKLAIFQEFSAYFENEDTLRRAVDVGFLLYDYNFFCRHFKGSIFAAFLLSIIEVYRKARDLNQDECISFYDSYGSTVSHGFQNMSNLAGTEQSKDIQRLNHFAKVSFRELGDMIEGTFKPFIKELYGMHLLQKLDAKTTLGKVKKVNLGTAVDYLITHHEDLSILYKHVLDGVPLHQWRNIAHHNTYSVDEASGKITCTYGFAEQKQQIVLDRKDLGRICISINNIWYLHKIARAIFAADNNKILSSIKGDGHPVSEDTAKLQIFETLAINGFQVACFEWDEAGMVFNVQDNEDRELENLEQLISDTMPMFFSLLPLYTIRVFASNGDPAFELRRSDLCSDGYR